MRRVALLLALLAGSAWAQEPAAPPVDVAPWTSFELADLGLSDSTRAYSTRSTMTFWFFARADELLTDARVQLRLASDPATLRTVEALEVRVNDEPVETLSYQDLLANKLPTLDVDARLLSTTNSLTLRLVGAGTGPCEEQVPAGSWALLDGGLIETRGQRLKLPNDLAVLPLPFLDGRRDRQPSVDIVLTETDSLQLGAAAVVAGWLGTRTSSSIEFVVHEDRLPKGSAVLFAIGEVGIDGWPVPVPIGPTLRMIPHPDPGSLNEKLLIVQGRDAEELMLAARALAATPDLPSGPVATFGSRPPPPPRAPYDAPRWLPPDERVTFEQITGGKPIAREGVEGGTLDLTFRIAPDVFTWPDEIIRITLDYEHVAPTAEYLPRVTVELNGQYVGKLAQPRLGEGVALGQDELLVHRSWFRGFNRLQFHLSWPDLEVPCTDGGGSIDGVETVIAGSSAIHLEDIPHFAQMPNVEQFVDDGFPFTTSADLSDSVLVLPDEPAPEDIGTLLSLVAHFAGVTGYADVAAPIVLEKELGPAYADRDVLAVGNAQGLRLLRSWADGTPLNATRGGLAPRSTGPGEQFMATLGGHLVARDADRAAQVLARSQETAAVIGLESPLQPGRSAVIVTANAPSAMPQAGDLRGFTSAQQAGGDLLLVDSRGRRSRYRIGPRYNVGELAPFNAVRWALAQHWLVLIPACLVIGLLAAAHVRPRLMRRSWERLNPDKVAA